MQYGKSVNALAWLVSTLLPGVGGPAGLELGQQESGQALQVSKMMLLTCSADALEGSPPGSVRSIPEQAQQV
jgi:hypothetical protein